MRDARRATALAVAVGIAILFGVPGDVEAKKLTKEQKIWLAARDRQPLSFVVSDEESPAAWARANEWIAKYALTPIQNATDVLIQNQAGTGEWAAEPQFTVIRAQQQDKSWKFDVIGRNANPLARGMLSNHTHALAYYIASGIPYPAAP